MTRSVLVPVLLTSALMADNALADRVYFYTNQETKTLIDTGSQTLLKEARRTGIKDASAHVQLWNGATKWFKTASNRGATESLTGFYTGEKSSPKTASSMHCFFVPGANLARASRELRREGNGGSSTMTTKWQDKAVRSRIERHGARRCSVSVVHGRVGTVPGEDPGDAWRLVPTKISAGRRFAPGISLHLAQQTGYKAKARLKVLGVPVPVRSGWAARMTGVKLMEARRPVAQRP